MRRTTLRIFTAVLLVIFLAGLLACGKPESTATAPTEPEYAGAMSENVLRAFNSGDYAAFSRDFDEAMKKAMSEASFKQTRAEIQGTYGEYISKQFSGLEENIQDIYTVVTYRVVFSKKSEAAVRVVFLETEDAVFVSGLWFQ